MWDTHACMLCKGGASALNGSLGQLLGPYGFIESSGEPIFVHKQCALWSGNVAEARDGTLLNVEVEVARGRHMTCTYCGKRGATVGCRIGTCKCNYHLPCAAAAECKFNTPAFQIACAAHAHLFAREDVASTAAADGSQVAVAAAAFEPSRAEAQRVARDWQLLEEQRTAAYRQFEDDFDRSGSESDGHPVREVRRPAKKPRLAPDRTIAVLKHLAAGAAAAQSAQHYTAGKN